MDRLFVRNFLLFVLLLAVCSSALIYNFIAGDRELGKIGDEVVHTHEVITVAEQLYSNIEGMLAAQRGYLLTSNETFLERYRKRKADVSEHIAQMKELTSANLSQQSRLEDIHNAYTDFSSRLEERTSTYIESSNKEVIEDVVDIDHLKEQIMNINKEVLEEEYGLLNERIHALEAKKTHYLTSLVASVIIGAILLLLFNAFLLRAQRRRNYAEESLRDTEDRLSLALEGTQDGIYDWNVTEDKLFYSGRFFAMLGYENKSKLGCAQDSLDLVHPDDLEDLNEAVEAYLNGELSEFSQEFRLQHKSGRWVWVQSRARALYDDSGKAYRMVGANTDITHLKHEQEKLEAEKEKIEAVNVAQRDFLAHMSHEIRTPLTAISGIAEIFQRKQDNLDDKQKKLIQTLNASAESLKDLVNDVLDFSKIESGDIDLDEQVFTLENLFAEVISMMSVKANEKGVSFVFDDAKIKGSDFYGDDTRLRQILVNLIGNALKFTDSGGAVSVKTFFENREDQEYLRVDVSDTGIGIAAENFDAIFDRFKQADSSVSRKYGGTGLGLPISKNLAQLMGGDIVLSSQIGKGSTFSLLLPMKLEIPNLKEYKAHQSDANKKLSQKIQSSLNDKTKALIVEDYEGNVIVLGYILEELNIDYDVAENGAVALEIWKKGHYDFVLMDVQMPEMDGFTATQEIRKHEKKENLDRVPIIGMTAHALVGDKDKCISSGMDSYLPKPIVEADFKKTIYKHLKKTKKAA